jgi:uncharacterized protein (TIGR00251 family)
MVDRNARIKVRLTPRSGKNEVYRVEAGTLFARVTAPPADGAANSALVSLLASVFDVPKSSVRIVSGASSREKLITIDGIEMADLEPDLARFAGRPGAKEKS